MNTFKILAACALIAPLTLGATPVYAQADYDRSQGQHDTQRSADGHRSAQGTQRQRMQRSGSHADTMDHSRQASGKDYQSADKSPLTRAPANTFHVDWLMGKDIDAQVGDNNIGNIRDILISEDGEVVAVIVGVGGLLDIGERDVAIRWDTIQHTRDQDGDSRFTTSTRRDTTGSRRDASGTRDRGNTTPRN